MTDRPDSGSAVPEELALYRALFHLAPVGIGIAAADGRLVVYNDAMLVPGGYTREDIGSIGNVAALYYHPEDREAILAEVAARGRVDRRAVQFRRKDGTPYDALLSLVPLELAGSRHALAIVEDVTEQRQLEAQLRQAQKMEAIGQLTGGIAHDLNNLLTVILASAELMARALPEATTPLQAELADIRAAATSGRELIRRLLGFSRQQVLQVEPVDLAATLQELVSLLRRVVPATITVQCEAGAPVSLVRADPAAVEQIVMNLVTNARDAMPQGGTLTLEAYETDTSAISVAARPGLQPGRYVWLAVADTGVGMDEASKARVFEPFFTTKAPGRGTGLGMAMVYGLAKEHGGYVHIASRLGVGTRVEVGFPVTPGLRRAARGAERPPAPQRTAAPRPAATVTILLVEDEGAVQRVATRALRSKGYHVLTASDGSEALRILHTAERIDLLVVDLVLPRLGGRQLVERLKHEARHIPVIYTSGYSRDAPDGGTGGPRGMFLSKPWTLEELFGAINRALDPTPQRLAEAEE